MKSHEDLHLFSSLVVFFPKICEIKLTNLSSRMKFYEAPARSSSRGLILWKICKEDELHVFKKFSSILLSLKILTLGGHTIVFLKM